MNFDRTAATALFSVLLSACAASTVRPSDAADRLLDTDRAFAAASRAHGAAAAFSSYMSEDGIELRPDGEPIRGRQSVSDSLADSSAHVLDWTPRQSAVSASGEMGWTWGEWQLLESPQSNKVLGHGKYLDVWRRDADGAWKLAIDVGNQSKRPAS